MLKIFFDETEIDSKWIRSLTQDASSFDSQFKLGSTICRVFELEIDKKAGLSSLIPNYVYIELDNIRYATLLVDEINDKYGAYYTYTLIDSMVMLNKKYEYEPDEPKTVLDILDEICLRNRMVLTTRDLYLKDMVITWSGEDLSQRDFVSYVAEVNGGYAYINKDGNLAIVPYSNTPKETIDVKMCSSFDLGSHHLIDRVYVELGGASKYYPETSENETCYINSNNILLTDSENYTIDGIIRHIYDAINGLEFYNLAVERCPINKDVICGDLITFTLDENEYKTIAQINLSYIGKWFGGYYLELDNSKQQETQVSASDGLIKAINIKVDRNTNMITQTVTLIDENGKQVLKLQDDVNKFSSEQSEIIQKADEISFKVSSLENRADDSESRTEILETAMNIQSDGVHISQGTVGNYTKIADNGMDIYVKGQNVAYARNDGFYAIDYVMNGWHMQTTNNNNSFNFIRKEYNDGINKSK